MRIFFLSALICFSVLWSYSYAGKLSTYPFVATLSDSDYFVVIASSTNGNVNWSTVKSLMSTNLNWQSMSQLVQSYNVNWSDVNRIATITNGINWQAISQVVQSSNINWTGVNTIKPITNGVNWQAIPTVVQQNNINWTSLKVYASSWSGGDRSGINWQSFGV